MHSQPTQEITAGSTARFTGMATTSAANASSSSGEQPGQREAPQAVVAVDAEEAAVVAAAVVEEVVAVMGAVEHAITTNALTTLLRTSPAETNKRKTFSAS
jgi:hypothetical protein